MSALADWLRQQLAARGWNQAELARATGESPQKIGLWLKGTQPEADALVRLAYELDEPLSNVLEMAEYPRLAEAFRADVSRPRPSRGLEELLAWWESASPRARLAVLSAVREMRGSGGPTAPEDPPEAEPPSPPTDRE